MADVKIERERLLLRREFEDLAREYESLEGDPSPDRQRQHARRLLDHIARLHGMLLVTKR